MSQRETVVEALRTMVVGGELRPGDRLVERVLAERLGVSRVPVREALRDLEHEGLAENRPPRGVVVRRLSAGDVAALFDVREALEAVVCRHVVASATDADLDRLDAVTERTAEAVDVDDRAAAVAANAEFHAVLVEIAGSAVLTAVMAPVAGRMRWLLARHDDVAAMNDDHRAIAAALRRRDADLAASLCRDHLEASRAAADAFASTHA